MTISQLSPNYIYTRKQAAELRFAAEARGEIRYQGNPCRVCDCKERYVSTNGCVKCVTTRWRRRKANMTPEKWAEHCRKRNATDRARRAREAAEEAEYFAARQRERVAAYRRNFA